MLAAGMRLDGVIVQSSVLDYNSNCGVFAPGEAQLRRLPAELWRDRRLARPGPAAAPPTPTSYADVLRSFATSPYGPAATAFAATRQPAPPGLIDQLVALTGAPTGSRPTRSHAIWQDNREFFHRGVSGQWRELLDDDGLRRYYARVAELADPDLVLGCTASRSRCR